MLETKNTYDLDENLYKSDFQILDKYQSFSKELTRLSLICLGTLGFLIQYMLFSDSKVDEKAILAVKAIFEKNCCLFYASVFSLIVSASCSIFHLYFSTDSLTHFISMLRKKQKGDDLKFNLERKLMNDDFELSGRLLLYSCICLILGIILGILFFIKFLP